MTAISRWQASCKKPSRVLSQRGLQAGIGMSIGGGTGGEQRMAAFLDGIGKKGIDTNDIAARIRQWVREQIRTES